jgi:hypothetical protein
MNLRQPAVAALDRWDKYLEPGEVLLWQGKPVAGTKALSMTWPLFFIALPVLAVGVFLFFAALLRILQFDGWEQVGLGLLVMVVSLPFSILGFSWVFGVWFADLTAHKHVRYALSDRRAYVARSWWHASVESHALHRDDTIELKQGPSDTIWLMSHPAQDHDDASASRIGFERISDGPAVYAILREALGKLP